MVPQTGLRNTRQRPAQEEARTILLPPDGRNIESLRLAIGQHEAAVADGFAFA
ncbi:MAG: hypothetical protein KIT16_17240 [Rhodospirillaceae bacterium]|nr:hypothetical protein [Rhodospirillaceae bacterium]